MSLAQPAHPPILGNRYCLLNRLGAGGMGTVFRAYDRLTGETVAIKRIISAQGTQYSTLELRLALANEFQALAGLRHPHIISVRDYGFAATNEQSSQPFFSMEFLPEARTILAAGQFLSTQQKIHLLLQLLRALTYLHQRKIIHCDLKPGNVLVTSQSGPANHELMVKTLDFGLAALTGQRGLASGTLLYMAPELLQGAAASVASDLFAAGVLAFELFAGWHPFGQTSAEVGAALVHSEPPWEYLELDAPLIGVLRGLLAKAPSQRYTDAPAVIAALSAASGQSLPVETAATRESFLQAAPFIGRTQELTQLQRALQQSMAGQGSGWLLPGESGVGKSRLLHELRTQALVQSALVLRGQAVADGGGGYRLWRDALRWLTLLAPLDEQGASVLAAVIPDLPTLLERPIAPAPALEPQAAQTRLHTTVTSLLQQATQQQPLLLLLEDLHWADENSLGLLRWLTRALENATTPFRLLIVAAFRRGEATHLVGELPAMQLLPLNRLAPAAIAELSVAILGKALGKSGQPSQLVDFLQRESEGNAFFVVEMLRVLAEEAGQLAQVAELSLPEHIFVGGMREVVQRRLRRMATQHQPMLRLAAVAGRQVDLSLLSALATTDGDLTAGAMSWDQEAWLTACVNANVLERQDDGLHWHFSHDKLREGILEQLTPAQRRADHALIAQRLEQIYAENLAPYYANLTFHFGAAQLVEPERHYAQLAGEQAAANFANGPAVRYFTRALQLTPADNLTHNLTQRFALLQRREQLYDLQALRDLQAADIAELTALAAQIGNPRHAAKVALRRSSWAESLSDYATAQTAGERAAGLARAAGAPESETTAYLQLGRLAWRQGQNEQARQWLQQALALAESAQLPGLAAEGLRNLCMVAAEVGAFGEAQGLAKAAYQRFQQLGDLRGTSLALNNLGSVCYRQGDYAAAQSAYAAALQLFRKLGDRHNESVTLNNIGLLHDSLGDLSGALITYEEALQIFQAIGNRQHEATARSNMGSIYDSLGDYPQAHSYFARSLQMRQALGDRQGEADTLAMLGLLYHHWGENEQARSYSEQCIALTQAIGVRHDEAFGWLFLGHAQAALGQTAAAEQAYQAALALRRQMGQANLVAEVQAGLVDVALTQGDLTKARASIENILDYLTTGPLTGTYEPLRIRLICYRGLVAMQDDRARQFLQDTYAALHEQAAQLTYETLRHSFLCNVLAHRQINELANNARDHIDLFSTDDGSTELAEVKVTK